MGTLCEPRDLDAARSEAVGEIMRGGLAFDRRIQRQDHRPPFPPGLGVDPGPSHADVKNSSGALVPLSAICLPEIDLLSRPKDSALPSRYI
jgi:hypothetical protein